jgi:hypothetical protein
VIADGSADVTRIVKSDPRSQKLRDFIDEQRGKNLEIKDAKLLKKIFDQLFQLYR